VANTKEEMDQWMFVLLEIVGNTVDGNNVSASRFIDDDDEIIPQDELSNFIKMDTVYFDLFGRKKNYKNFKIN